MGTQHMPCSQPCTNETDLIAFSSVKARLSRGTQQEKLVQEHFMLYLLLEQWCLCFQGCQLSIFFFQHIFIKTQLPTSLPPHFLLYTLILGEGRFRNAFMRNKEDLWLDDFSIIYHIIIGEPNGLVLLMTHSYTLHLTQPDLLNIFFE